MQHVDLRDNALRKCNTYLKCNWNIFLLLNLKEQQKSGRDRRSPFLNISSSSRVKGLKMSSFRSEVSEKAVEIDQNQENL